MRPPPHYLMPYQNAVWWDLKNSCSRVPLCLSISLWSLLARNRKHWHWLKWSLLGSWLESGDLYSVASKLLWLAGVGIENATNWDGSRRNPLEATVVPDLICRWFMMFMTNWSSSTCISIFATLHKRLLRTNAHNWHDYGRRVVTKRDNGVSTRRHICYPRFL